MLSPSNECHCIAASNSLREDRQIFGKLPTVVLRRTPPIANLWCNPVARCQGLGRVELRPTAPIPAHTAEGAWCPTAQIAWDSGVCALCSLERTHAGDPCRPGCTHVSRWRPVHADMIELKTDASFAAQHVSSVSPE